MTTLPCVSLFKISDGLCGLAQLMTYVVTGTTFPVSRMSLMVSGSFSVGFAIRFPIFLSPDKGVSGPMTVDWNIWVEESPVMT